MVLVMIPGKDPEEHQKKILSLVQYIVNTQDTFTKDALLLKERRSLMIGFFSVLMTY